MSKIYSIRNTANTETIVVRPGARNGPDGAIKNSDVNLHGMGSISWGEEMGENFIRLTENFACPESVGTPGFPQTSADLGEGYGINNPIQGQLWFNTTSQSLMVYNGTDWKQAGGTAYDITAPSANPSNGDLWFDVNYFGSPGIGQLLIYHNGSWESVAEHYVPLSGGTMTGFLTLSANPTANLHAATKQYVDTEVASVSPSGLYLPLAGGSMNAAAQVVFNNGSGNNVWLNEGAGDTGVGADFRAGASCLMVADNSFNINFDTVGSGGNFIVARGAQTTTGDTDLFTIYGSSGLLREMTNATSYKALVIDDRDIPNKKYVDDKITTTINLGGATRLVKYWSTASASASNGDIYTTGDEIWIRSNGTWKKVYPAVYS